MHITTQMEACIALYRWRHVQQCTDGDMYSSTQMDTCTAVHIWSYVQQNTDGDMYRSTHMVTCVVAHTKVKGQPVSLTARFQEPRGRRKNYLEGEES